MQKLNSHSTINYQNINYMNNLKKNKVIRFLLLPFYKKYINLSWYLYSKILKKNITIKIKKFEKIYFTPLGHIAKELFIGNFEPNEKLFIENNLSINSNVLNIGANIGYYTILASKISNSGIIFSFEPSKLNYDRLIKNISLNNLKNIKTYNIALGNTNDTLNLYADSKNPHLDSHYTLCNDAGINGEVEKVTVAPLDDFLNIIPKIDIVIIDVEGFEFNLLNGAKEFIKNNLSAKYLIEVTKNQLDVIKLMQNFGFNVYAISNNGKLIQTEEIHGNLVFMI